MPKLKTHKGASKRFKITAKGKYIKHRSANRSHINTKMTTKRKRHLRHISQVNKVNISTVKSQIPYA